MIYTVVLICLGYEIQNLFYKTNVLSTSYQHKIEELEIIVGHLLSEGHHFCDEKTIEE